MDLVARQRQDVELLGVPHQVVAGDEQVECRDDPTGDCCPIYVSKHYASLSGCVSIEFLISLSSLYNFILIHSKTHYARVQCRRSKRLYRRSAQSCSACCQHTSKVSLHALSRSISEMSVPCDEQNPDFAEKSTRVALNFNPQLIQVAIHDV